MFFYLDVSFLPKQTGNELTVGLITQSIANCFDSYDNDSDSTVFFQLDTLHHSKNRCEHDPNYLQNNCFVDCFMNRLAHQNLTCRLPYMQGNNIVKRCHRINSLST